jgi:hypothetical protein
VRNRSFYCENLNKISKIKIIDEVITRKINTNYFGIVFALNNQGGWVLCIKLI